MAKKQDLTDHEIKKCFIRSLKYVGANIMTSVFIFALIFVITIIMGLENPESILFLKGSTFQTIMLPLVIWYYAYLAFTDGYADAVAEEYNKSKILVSAIPIFAIQLIFAFAAIAEGAEPDELGAAKTISLFLLNIFAGLFNKYPNLMPEIMVLPCIVPPIAMYIGYTLARFKEARDHRMSNTAKDFRRQLEKEQYKEIRDRLERETYGEVTDIKEENDGENK